MKTEVGIYIVAEHINDRQIIVQQVRCYSRVLVCMYVYMSAKNSELSVVGLELNCTADYALFRLLHYPYIQRSLSHILRISSESI